MSSQSLWVEVDGERLPARIVRGQVQVELPFDVDFVRLAALLRQQGYFYAHHPERVDAQGWGRRLDREGYYPYWLWREGVPGRTATRIVFALPPREYVRPASRQPAAHGRTPATRRRRAAADVEAAAELAPAAQPTVGPATVEAIRRWVTFLRRASR